MNVSGGGVRNSRGNLPKKNQKEETAKRAAAKREDENKRLLTDDPEKCKFHESFFLTTEASR